MGFVVIIVLIVIVTLFIVWVDLFRLNAANTDIDHLKERVKSLQRALDAFTKRVDKVENQLKGVEIVEVVEEKPTLKKVSEFSEREKFKPFEKKIDKEIPIEKPQEPEAFKVELPPIDIVEPLSVQPDLSEAIEKENELEFTTDFKNTVPEELPPISASESSTQKSDNDLENKTTFERKVEEKLTDWAGVVPPVSPSEKPSQKSKAKVETKISFERQVGEKLTVWVGGIALALAGFFLVKYSIDKGYLTEKVRVIMGFLFGCGLLYAGHFVRGKPGFANGVRISQALSGAGIATLYAVIFAATHMYHFISDWTGFFGMAVVTATAVVLSLRHGMPIALLGMVGGYLAPAFVGPNDPPAYLMFGYLYLLLAGLLTLMRHKKWWGLAIPTAIFSFIWVCYWLVTRYHPGDSLELGLFLFGLIITLIVSTKGASEDPKWALPVSVFNSLVLVAVMILMATIIDKADFGLMEWGMYALLSIGSIFLSIYDEKAFKFAPWLSLLINGILLALWHSSDIPKVPLMMTLFAVIYIVASYLSLWQRRRPLYWGSLAIVTSLGYFMLAYYKLNDTEFMKFIPYTWAVLSLPLALFAFISIKVIEKIYDKDENKNNLLLAFYVLLGAFVSLAMTIEIDVPFHWELFGLLGVGSIALAFYDTKSFVVAPFLAMLISAWSIFYWQAPSDLTLEITILVFAVIYALPSLYFYLKNYSQAQWGGLLGLTTICFYLLAYFKLHEISMFKEIPFFWGISAIVLAGFAFVFLRSAMAKNADGPLKDRLLTIFTISATTFVSLALTIELEKDFLPVAFTMEMLVLAWVNNRVVIKCLRPITGVLALIFAILLIPQILLLIQLTGFSILEIEWKFQADIPLVNWPIFQLGVPAAMFVGASYFLKKQKDGLLVGAFEYASVALTGIMGYYLTRHFFHTSDKILFVKADFLERGIITNVFFAFSFICFLVGRFFSRPSYLNSAMILFGVSLFRLVYFDFMIYNPIWATQEIKGMVIFNSLAITYGLSMFWVLKGSQELKRLGKESFAAVVSKLPLLLLFTWASYNVRYYFHQPYLNGGIMTKAEIYSYSAAWLFLGVGLLILGIARKSKSVRFASLAMMLLTVGKVFLYDGSELEGLLRVGSFLGLGLSLIGLSYFYTRYVFGKNSTESEEAE